jgi:hypothetical protein
MYVMAGASVHAELSPGSIAARPHQGMRITLLALMVASLLATCISVAGFFVPGAVVAACFFMAFYVALLALRASERRMWAHLRTAPPRTDLGPDDPEVFEVAQDPPADSIVAERAEWRLGLIVAAALAVPAVLLAGFLVGWGIAGPGALAFFALMLLMGAPVWLAAAEDEIEEAEERADLPHPASIR